MDGKVGFEDACGVERIEGKMDVLAVLVARGIADLEGLQAVGPIDQ